MEGLKPSCMGDLYLFIEYLTNYCFHFYCAEGLAYIMNELFGGVVYAGIDTDKHRYPIGKILVILHFTHYVSSRWLQAYS